MISQGAFIDPFRLDSKRVHRLGGIARSPIHPFANATSSFSFQTPVYPTMEASRALLDRLCPSDDVLNDLADRAMAWASLHGLSYGAGLSDDLSRASIPAPVSLMPVPYPSKTFYEAKRAALAFNTMIDAVSQDEEFLQFTLAAAARSDEFTAGLLRVLKATKDAREARKSRGIDVNLAVNRSDYMLHTPTGGLLQVELNTIASSFGCLSTLVSRMHAYILGMSGATEEDMRRLPANDALNGIVDVLAEAADMSIDTSQRHGVIVMVVQPDEQNTFDQRWIEVGLWERHHICTLRKTLAEIAANAKLDDQDNLIIDGQLVSVVYFRAGYAPTDYLGQSEWKARELIERSTAAACPSVAMQLAGSKKVQQALARNDVLGHYANNEADVSLMQTLFAGLWALDDLENDKQAASAVRDAMHNPDNYVLKPQREGGGNNIYGQEVRQKLSTVDDLGAYILMQRIRPPINKSIMIRKGNISHVETLSELGIYGTYLRKGRQVLVNREVGHLVRTKAATSDEGGVAAGFAVLDSPYLYDL